MDDVPRGLTLQRRLPTDATWKDRWDVTGRSRRLVPAAVALRWVRRRAARAWSADPALREAARARMAAIVTGTHREPELEALARAVVLEDAAWSELFLRPWKLVEGRRVERLDRLADAVGTGRGVIVSYCHLGPFQGVTSVPRRVGRTPWVVGGAWIGIAPQPGEAGRLLERWRGLLSRAQSQLILVGTGVHVQCTALLRQGELVCILFDMPGGTTTPWLGKPIDLASGTARIARDADALVAPVSSWRHRGRAHSRLLEVLDPRDYEDDAALHLALAAVHEQQVLARPEALENPMRPGAWEDRATASGWRAVG